MFQFQRMGIHIETSGLINNSIAIGVGYHLLSHTMNPGIGSSEDW